MKPESQSGAGSGPEAEAASTPRPAAAASASASSTAATPPMNQLSIVELLCPTLLVDPSTAKSTNDLINKKETSLVLLYFSAHWCPPCKAFTPKLRAFYKSTRQQQQQQQQQQQHHPLEIVYVSSDRTLAEFNEYFGAHMPWLAVGASDDESVQAKNRLAQALQIRSIPTLVVLRREKPGVDNWLYVTNRGRDQVVAQSSSPENLVKEWLEMPAVPLDEAAALEGGGGGGGVTTLKEIVVTILRNPMYLFALIYLIKYLTRAYLGAGSSSGRWGGAQGMGEDEDPFGAGLAAAASSEDSGAGDSEF
jgi:thiol-disulfide isomerase/thioredoxin